jgi:hypothetical protein
VILPKIGIVSGFKLLAAGKTLTWKTFVAMSKLIGASLLKKSTVGVVPPMVRNSTRTSFAALAKLVVAISIITAVTNRETKIIFFSF